MSQADSSLPISGLNLSSLNAIRAIVPQSERGPSAPTDSRAASDEDRRRSAAWAKLIQGQLADWRRDPQQLEDEDIPPPSADTIDRVMTVAMAMHDQGLPPPDRIVPTGDGGIALQFELNNEFISIEVEPEGLVELLVFCDGRLTHRAAI